MIVEQIWTANAGRNFNYLIACGETGEALAVDPLDHEKCLAAAKAKGWTITQILNTHEHRDHTGGNQQMIAATGAKVLAHANAKDKIPEMDRGLAAGDVIKVGKTVELECLDTPGHTMSAYLRRRAWRHAGTVLRRHTVQCRRRQLPQWRPSERALQHLCQPTRKLPDETLVYPGHDYIARNLAFTLDREPDNAKAKAMLPQMERQDTGEGAGHDLGVGEGDQHLFPADQPVGDQALARGLPRSAGTIRTRKTVFLRLRELRNKW